MDNVIIIGGGIAGLTAAHELIDEGYHVMLIERNDIVGGLARTYQDAANKICPYEYSWRAYGKWYQNVYNIMKRIPYTESTSVYDKLVTLQGGPKTCNKKIPLYENSFRQMPHKDIIKLLPTVVKYYSSSNQKNIDDLSGIGLREFIIKTGLSKTGEDLMGKIVGPYLGFDYHNASLYDLLYAHEMISNNSSSLFNFSITSLPTNYIWFNKWTSLLISKGLDLRLNTQVIKLNFKNNKILSIHTHNKLTGQNEIIKGQYYINCTGPEILKDFLYPFRLSLFYKNIKNVAANGRQIQLSIYYYINKKIYLQNKNTLAYLPNTPWLLMVLPTGHIWGDKYLSKYCDSKIKEVISVGICEPYVKGILIKKPWSKCNRKEIEIEAWYQLMNDKDFINNICIKGSINNIKIIDFKMWDSFVYKNGKIDTYEPKWANNINTIQYRPNVACPIKNLFISGAYTNTSTCIYSMESAAESGIIAAKAVCTMNNKKDNIFLHTKKKSSIMAPIRFTSENRHILLVLLIIIIYYMLV